MNFLLEHLGLSARDPATLKNWYAHVLGAKLIFDNGRTPPTVLLGLPGGSLLEIYPGDFALKETGNNQVHAAKLLGITRATLRKRIEKFGIQPELKIA